MRKDRIQVPFTPAQRDALRVAQRLLGLATEVDTVLYLLTGPLAPYIRQDASSATCSGGGVVLSNGIQMDTTRNPDGTQVAPERIPLGSNKNNNLINNNSNQGIGESEGKGNFRGVRTDTTLPGFEADTEIERCLGLLATVQDWPFDRLKDEPLLMDLINDFPKAAPLEVIKRLKISAIDMPMSKRGARNRLRTYFSKAEGFGQVRKAPVPGPVDDTPPSGGYSAAGVDLDGVAVIGGDAE